MEENTQTPVNTNKKEKKVTFGKIMLASGVGTLIVMILIGLFKLMLLFGIIGSVNSTSGSQVALTSDSFLKIDLTKYYTERNLDEMSALLMGDKGTGFRDVIRSITKAADDSKIKGIYLYMGSGCSLSWGKSEELRHALALFSASEKPILAYADNYSQQGYFIASVADSIYLNPSGMLEFRGIGAEVMFYKELLDKLEVKMNLVRPKSNSFKSAGETYTMNHLSDANKLQLREYINGIWSYVVDQIAEARDIPVEVLQKGADNLDLVMPADALNGKMIDRLCFENDVKVAMKEQYGAKQTVPVEEYAQSLIRNGKSKNKIAIIYAEGDVITGSGNNIAVYSDKITKALDDAAKDNNIKAIVLRVNSPGGAVTASEIMTDAVRRAKAQKPVIVSMSDVAASAGYEISCNADYIIAEPTTITGSIGVFAAIPEIGGTLRRYLGITTDTVNTNANATSLGILRPMSPRSMELMQRNVEEFYTVFVDRVAKGRGLDNNFVDSIARGRVWTGREALKLGLVDALGGLDDAVIIAAERAGVSDYQEVDYPADEGLLATFQNRKASTEQFSAKASANDVVRAPFAGDGVWVPGEVMKETLKRITDSRELQARVEFFIITE